MITKLRKRIASAVCAVAMLFSPVSSIRAVSDTSQDDFTHQSFSLYPNGEEAEQVITLEGMMPDGAEVQAIDVSEEYQGLSAYDITILDGSEEYQPETEYPIYVEISDPAIPENEALTLWHIQDDGTREQITDFTAENGKISFYATGFSVYEIVLDDEIQPIASEESGWKKLTDTAYLAANGEEGFYISWYHGGRFASNQYHYYLKSTEKRSGLTVTENMTDNSSLAITNNKCNYNEVISKAASAGAVKYYFELSGDKYYIYCYDGNELKYVATHNETGSYNSLKLVDNKTDASLYSVSAVNGYFTLSDDNNFKWSYANQGNQEYNGIGAFNGSSNENSFILWYYIPPVVENDDPYQLDSKTYGLMSFTGGTHGYALMAEEQNVHTLVELVTHQTADAQGITLYVDEGSEVTKWTFHTAGEDNYTLSAETDSGVQYLTVSENELLLTDSAENASAFKVTPDNQGKIQLSAEGKYIIFTSIDDGENTVTNFSLSSLETAGNTWLNLLNYAELDDDDLITYSADRISISDAVNGQKVIVYTRVWDEINKKYDIYAIDYDGTLYPCYASGGKILWLGDDTGSLEWEFTEYYDEVTKQPNYYYELYNPYSEKYIAPQISSNQILSDSTIGINLPNRRNQEFYSDLIAWDNVRYAYVGMKPNDEKTKLVPCAQSASYPFYFAALEDLNLSGKLHEVATIDNTDYGITMKMIDFDGTSSGTGATQQNEYLVTTTFTSDKATKGLLSNSLDENGYPIAVQSNQSLESLYSDSKTVNHLFIESVHHSSGYFEFDSTQNFATLKDSDDDNFTVYRELGTIDGETKTTLKHGQFLPYNTITAGNYATSNPQNMYSADARTNNNNAGLLPDDNPRKYEKLFSAGNIKGSGENKIDYYFGMEMSASFVQTVSGLDAWGHDIIFEFRGDDDFWLYVDNELVIDLGGIHSALSGNINFRTGEVNVNGKDTTLKALFEENYKARGLSDSEITAKLNEIFEDNGKGQYIFKDCTTHTMHMFYMERGAGASNLHMRFNLASVVPRHVSVSKTLSGDGAEALDTDFLEYPFQIYYTVDENGNGKIDDNEEFLLGNDDAHIRVTYQNSNQPVTFIKRYRPPGFTEEQAYHNIYFINPSKSAEIAFPDNTIGYRIVECAVDSTVYNNVTINGEAVPDKNRTEIRGLINYSSNTVTAELRPTISFDNHVSDDVIKDFYITKKLLDSNDQEITDDPATFNFRLYLSSVDVDADSIPPANMYSYYVLSPSKKLCRYDSEINNFAETALFYSRDNVKAVQNGEISNLSIDDITFTTSGFGAISKIPAGYTVCVPSLPVGTLFKVTEDVKTGYGLKEYVRLFGDKTDADGNVTKIASYQVEEEDSENIGRVIADQNPQMEIHNKKGYGLTVNKKWSDLSITTAHDTIYTAIYIDGELLENSVKQIASPATSAYYFWETLEENQTSLENYTVKEVTLTGENLKIAEDGTVTGYETVTPLEEGSTINLNAKRTAKETPSGETPEAEFDYIVSYESSEDTASARKEIITNTREGGFQIRLFEWSSAVPLKDGHFTLVDSSGRTIGNYTSDSAGTVTILYNFEKESLYTLQQTSAPKGFVGLQKKIRFQINADDTISMYEQDGTTWSETEWANSKHGENGIIAFLDVYNKPFCFKIMKTDSEDSEIKLDSAHFALYKQANTTISGYVKNKQPMTGFEDMATVNGSVDICGGDSGRVINPGVNGSVYFLTETKAPFHYAKLDKDIIFRISALGVPSLISNDYQGTLVETEDSYIYTLSVPNTKDDEDSTVLTIEKQVNGAFGNKEKEFNFTITIANADDKSFIWAKNGEELSPMPKTSTFTMKHADRIEIVLPIDAEITLTEENQEYTTAFQLNDSPAQEGNTITFQFTESSKLLVTNTLDGVIATGISTGFQKAWILILLPAGLISILIYSRRKFS